MFPVFITVTRKDSDEFVVVNTQSITKITHSKAEGTQINIIDEFPLFVNQSVEDVRRLMTESITNTIWSVAEDFKQRERDLAAGTNKGGKNGGRRGA